MSLAADVVLVAHALFAAFVVAGLPLILLGGWLRWRWVREPWLRCLHLAGIAVVAAQSWLGVVCPLTTLEMWLRARAGDPIYAGGFVQHWLRRLLFFEAPGWVFLGAYTAFGLLVVLAWWLYPPRFRGGATRR